MRGLPKQKPGFLWMTEPGVETEIEYRMGYPLPEFSMLPLLDNPKALDEIEILYRGSFEVAVKHGLGFIVSGFDYHASRDYGARLGYTPEGLADAVRKGLETIDRWIEPYKASLPDYRIQSFIGPKGDAYGTGGEITAEIAEEYHGTQLDTVLESVADLVCAITFNNIPEAVGVARAAKARNIPLNVSLTLTNEGILRSGPTLKDAIIEIDAQTGGSIDFFMVNCAHPVEFLHVLEKESWMRRIRGFRPNAVAMEQVALCKLGHIEDGDPVELGGQMADLARAYPWMDIWGGCCGTGNPHLEQIAREVTAARAA